eukprot:GILJ01002280.1.p1 GENE.GILJ01002280.1~~GILJ01002280.1.p1  ORF type:complete len:237 (-),score=18.77 GILJ01002280.1:99-809(-)
MADAKWRPWYGHAMLLTSFLIVFWVITAVNVSDNLTLSSHGIVPRTGYGLFPGVMIAPFIHSSFKQIAINSFPWVIFGEMLLLKGYFPWLLTTATTWLVGGFFTWTVSAEGSSHVGISAVNFGYIAFHLAVWIWVRPIKYFSLIVTLVVGVLYTGVLFGALSLGNGNTWEAALCGFVSGLLIAFLYGKWVQRQAAKHRDATTDPQAGLLSSQSTGVHVDRKSGRTSFLKSGATDAV